MEFEHEFEAVLEDGHGDGGVFVVVPFSVADAYGVRGLLPVRATLDGFPYQGSLKPLGDGYHALLVLKEIRRALKKTVGDILRVQLSRDTAPRQVELPDDLAAALAANDPAREFLASLSYSEQREYARWLQGAKTPEIRHKRLQETVYRLERGLKRG